MKKLLIVVFLLASVSGSDAGTLLQHEALYTYCVGHWSKKTVGATFFFLAVEEGLPIASPIGTAPSARNVQAEALRQFESWHIDKRDRPTACAAFIERGVAYLEK